MNKKILSLVLVLAMLLTSLVMVVPTSATTATEELKTKGYILAVNASRTGTSTTTFDTDNGDANDNGQSIVYLLSDGTFMIFDGGQSATDAKHLSEQLHDIAARHGLSKVVVSMWNFTHPHLDHMGIINHWEPYAAGVEVREIWYNPTNWGGSSYGTKLRSYYPNATIKAVHAGEEYQFADVHIKILWAADSTNAKYYETQIYGVADYDDLYGKLKSGTSRADQNNASTIMKLTIGKQTVLMAGDAGYEPFEYIYNSTTNNVSKDDLKCTIFQMTHHSVGSASKAGTNSDGDYKADTLSTPNNKHFAVMDPDKIIIPVGARVLNETLKGKRAIPYEVTQPGTSTKALDGYYGLLTKFGVVAAAGSDKQFTSETEFKSKRTDGSTYWIAGWLPASGYTLTDTRQQFFTSDTDTAILNTKSEMLEGASIRVVTDEALNGSGIRFTSKVSATTLETLKTLKSTGKITDYRFGTLVFRGEAVNKVAGSINAQSLTAAGQKFVDIPAKKGLMEMTDASGNTYYQINAAIVNIKEANYRRAFAAVSYIEYDLPNGNTMRTYSDFDTQKNARTICDVAFEALNDNTATAGMDAKGYDHKYAVTVEYTLQNGEYVQTNLGTTKYNPYSSAQRAILASYLVNYNNPAIYDDDDTLQDMWD